MRPAWRRETVPTRWRDGTHRTATPEDTLARIRPFQTAAGITRVAMLTGLDTIGLPVAAAYRPNSRSIAVHQGKGTSIAAAKASAVMEAIETHHAETVFLPFRHASYADMVRHGETLDPRDLPRSGAERDLDGRLLWVCGEDVADGAPVWVPHALVGIDLTVPASPFQETTNGLASGNHEVEAVAHAIAELVERDAVSLWQAMPPEAQAARAVDLATVAGRPPAALLARFAECGMAVRAWDVTSGIGLPAFACLLVAADGADGVQPELGFGCHADVDVALSRALTEAAQARLTVISGARDDLAASGYEAGGLRDRHRAARDWLAAPATRDFRHIASHARETLSEELDAMLHCLARAGFGRVVRVDLSQETFGIPVARVLIAGLEGPWTAPGAGYVPGPRARP